MRRATGLLAYRASCSSRLSWSSWPDGSHCWKPSSGQNQTWDPGQALMAQVPPASFEARGEDTQPTTRSSPPGDAARGAERLQASSPSLDLTRCLRDCQVLFINTLRDPLVLGVGRSQ